MSGRDSERDAELEAWREYPNTVLELGDPPARIDLRAPLSADDREALRRAGLDRPFAVMTAENPEGEHAEDEGAPARERRQRAVNALRDQALREALVEEVVPFVRVDGVAPDGGHREHCVAIPT